MKLCVCICTCDRPGPLARLLEALAAMPGGPLPGQAVGLVIVDNLPDGRTREVCDAYREKLGMELRLVEETQRGISFARNRAVAEALAEGADLIAFLDDDDVPEPDWLQRLTAKQARTGADIVLGGWAHDLPDDMPAALRRLPVFRPLRPEAINDYGLPKWAGTMNMLIACGILERMLAAGPVFAPELAFVGGEDNDFLLRAKQHGAVVAACPESRVHHLWDPSRMTWRGVLKRGYRQGNSKMWIARRHGQPAAARALAREATVRLVVGSLRLPLVAHLPEQRGKILFDIARDAGKLSAFLGVRSAYYADTPTQPPALDVTT